MDTFERFFETQMPPKEAFFNYPTDSHIIDEDHEIAKKFGTCLNARHCSTTIQSMSDQMSVYWQTFLLHSVNYPY